MLQTVGITGVRCRPLLWLRQPGVLRGKSLVQVTGRWFSGRFGLIWWTRALRWPLHARFSAPDAFSQMRRECSGSAHISERHSAVLTCPGITLGLFLWLRPIQETPSLCSLQLAVAAASSWPRAATRVWLLRLSLPSD